MKWHFHHLYQAFCTVLFPSSGVAEELFVTESGPGHRTTVHVPVLVSLSNTPRNPINFYSTLFDLGIRNDSNGLNPRSKTIQSHFLHRFSRHCIKRRRRTSILSASPTTTGTTQAAHTLSPKALSVVGDECRISSTQETQMDGKYTSDFLPPDQTRDF